MKKILLASVIVLSLFFSVSCAEEKKKPIVNNTQSNEAKAMALALAIERSIYDGNNEDLVDLWDVPSFKKNIKKNMNVLGHNQYVEGFLYGLSQGLHSFADKLSQSGYYDFIRIRYDEEVQTYYLLFRFFSDLEGINYHEYRVVQKDGEFKFDDIYIYITGEHFSNTMARLGLFSMPERTLFKSTSTLDDKVKDVKHIQNAMTYQQSGQYKEAYEEFDKIKTNFKKSKALLLLKAQNAIGFDLEKYKETILEIMAAFPEDATLNLLYIDYYTLTEDYDQAIDCIEELKKRTGDDFVTILKGHIHFEKGEMKKALECYDYMVDNFGIPEPYIYKLSVYAIENNFDEAVNMLDILIKDFEYEKSGLIDYIETEDDSDDAFFESLIASQPYKAWKNS